MGVTFGSTGDFSKGNIWLILNTKYHWDEVSKVALEYGLVFSDWKKYDQINAGHHGIRFGFASHTETEMQEIVRRLSSTFQSMSKNNVI